jgi:hypothetical protein
MLCALLIGTKWSAIPLAGGLVALYLFTLLQKEQILTWKSVAITALLLPLLLIGASAETYINNHATYGRYMPLESDVGRGLAFADPFRVHIHRLIDTCYASIVDVFRLPILLTQHFTGQDLFETLSGHGSFYLFRSPLVSSHAPLGYPFIILIFISATGLLLNWPAVRPYRSTIVVAFGYCGLVLLTTGVGGGTVRYLLPAYVVLIPPVATAIGARAPRWLKSAAAILAVYISGTSVLFSQDRTPPLPLSVGNKYGFTAYWRDHDELMLLGAPGVINFFRETKLRVPNDKSLLLVDNTNHEDLMAAELPYFMPFLFRRSPENTAIATVRLHGLPDLQRFDYVLVWSRRRGDPELAGFRKELSNFFPSFTLYSAEPHSP